MKVFICYNTYKKSSWKMIFYKYNHNNKNTLLIKGVKRWDF